MGFKCIHFRLLALDCVDSGRFSGLNSHATIFIQTVISIFCTYTFSHSLSIGSLAPFHPIALLSDTKLAATGISRTQVEVDVRAALTIPSPSPVSILPVPVLNQQLP